jgi:hypothetical protein
VDSAKCEGSGPCKAWDLRRVPPSEDKPRMVLCRWCWARESAWRKTVNERRPARPYSTPSFDELERS